MSITKSPKLLFVFFLISIVKLNAQNLPFKLDCNNPPIPLPCDNSPYNAIIKIVGREVFCEGELITAYNRTEQQVDSSIYCWGDGTSPVIISGKDSASHKYDFSNDTCLISDNNTGLIKKTITLITFKRCATGYSVSSASKDIYIRFHPKIDLAFDKTICEKKAFTVKNSSCGNDVADSIRCTYDFGIGIPVNNCASSIDFTYPQGGTFIFKYTMHNRCRDVTIIQTLNVIPLPTAVATVKSGATLLEDSTFIVCSNQGNQIVLDGSQSKNTVSYDWTPKNPSDWNWITRSDTVTPKLQFKAQAHGIYTITLTVTNSCGQKATQSLIIKVIPFIFLNIDHHQDDCKIPVLYQPTPIILGATYTFDDIPFDPKVGIKIISFGQHIVKASVINECQNQSISDTFSIVEPVPVKISNPRGQTVCINSVQQLNALPIGGTWKGIGISSFGEFKPLMSGNFLLTYERGSGDCKQTDTINFFVLKKIELLLDQPKSACLPFDYKPTPIISGVVYTFDDVPFDPDAGIKNVGFGQHVVKVSIINQCQNQSVSDTFSIIERLPVKISSSHGQTVCVNSEQNLDASPAGGTWKGIGISSLGVFKPVSSGNFVLTYVRGVGDCMQMDTISFSVLKNIELALDQPKSACQSFDYKPTPVIFGVIYTLDSTTFDPNFGVKNVGFGQHIVKVSIVNQCQNQSLSDTFNIVELKPIKIFTVRGQMVCINSAQQLDASPIGGTWKGTNVSTSGLFKPISSGSFLLTYERGSGDCKQTDTISFSVLKNIELVLDQPKNACQPFEYKPSFIVNEAKYTFDSKPFSPNDSTIHVGVGTHTVTAALNTICHGVDTVLSRTFNVTGLPSIQINSKDTTICFAGDSIVLKATASTGDGLWMGDGAMNGLFFPRKAGFGTHLLKFHAGGVGCETSGSISIQVVGVNVNTGFTDRDICNADNAPDIPLQGGTPSGGVYHLSDTSGQVLTQINPARLGPGTYKIYYVVYTPSSAAIACPSYNYFTVNIYGRSKGSITGNNAQCTNKALTLQANGTDKYDWDWGDGAKDTGAKVTHTYTRAGNFKVILITTSQTNCRDTTSKNITIDTPSDAIASPHDTTICSNSSVKFRIASGLASRYIWKRNNQTVDSTRNPATINFLNLGERDTTYHVVLSIGTGACPNQEQDLSVLVHPKVKAVISASKQTVCSNESIVFAPNKSIGKISNWHWEINGINFYDSIPPIQYFSTDTAIKTIFVRLMVEDITCGKDTATTAIQIIPLTTKAFINVDKTIVCPSDSLRFTNLSSKYARIVWKFDDTNFQSSDSIVMYPFKKPGTYNVTLYAFSTCGGFDSIVQKIRVLEVPVLTGIDYALPDKCNSLEVHFKPNIASSGFNVYAWQFGDNTKSSIESPTHLFPKGSLYVVRLTVTSAATNCPVMDSLDISIDAPLKLLVDTVTPDKCGISDAEVFLSTSGGITPFLFAKDNTNQWQSEPKFSKLSGRKNYTFFVKDKRNCTDSIRIFISGRDSLQLDLVGKYELNLGDSVFVKVKTNFSPSEIQWLPSDTSVRSPRSLETIIFPLDDRTYFISVHDNLNCLAIDSVFIKIRRIENIKVADIFSPNGDNHNDFLYVQASKDIKIIKEFKVFNRWGNLVFENYNFKPNIGRNGWDGNFNAQTAQPDDNFRWFVVAEGIDGRTIEASGISQLLK